MKIALCFHGMSHGKNTLKDCIGSIIKNKDDTVPDTSDSFKKNVININENVDVFFHTWINDISKINTIISQYNPKLYLYEPQKTFNPSYDDALTLAWYSDFGAFHKSDQPPIINFPGRYFSKWYSLYTANLLKSTYETMHGFKYDFVIHCRFDLQFNVPLIFTEYDKTSVYVAKNNHTSYDDNWIFGNSENMDIIGSLYENIYDYLLFYGDTYKKMLYENGMGVPHVGNHDILTYHIKHNGLKPKIKMMLEYTKEFSIPKAQKE